MKDHQARCNRKALRQPLELRRIDRLTPAGQFLAAGAAFGIGLACSAWAGPPEPSEGGREPFRGPGQPIEESPSPAASPTAGPAIASAAALVEIERLGLDASRPSAAPDDDSTAVLAGRLIHTEVRTEIRDGTVAEVLSAFSRVVEVPVLPFFVQQAGDPGLSPLERINVLLPSGPAHEVLQAIVEAAMGESGAWQIHEGRVEVGPKWVLARASARRTEAIPIRDLLLEPPSTSRFGSVRDELMNQFPEAIMKVGPGLRSTPNFLAAQLIIEVEIRIEPQAWIADETTQAVLVRSGEDRNPLARAGQWASMTSRDGVLLVTAPDFVLRGIRGDPKSLPPAIEAVAVSRRDLVQPDEPVFAEVENGRVDLLGFLPSKARSRPSRDAEGQISRETLENLGRLSHARLQVRLDETPMRDAIEMLAKTTRAAILPIWASGGRLGIDPDSRVSLELEDAGGIEVLEMLLALSSATSATDWQVRGGAIEIGPKAQLARPEARRTVRVDVRDLLIEAPYFIGPSRVSTGTGLLDVITPLERQFGRELGMVRSIPGAGSSQPGQSARARSSSPPSCSSCWRSTSSLGPGSRPTRARGDRWPVASGPSNRCSATGRGSTPASSTGPSSSAVRTSSFGSSSAIRRCPRLPVAEEGSEGAAGDPGHLRAALVGGDPDA